jgi:superfamily I DNA/RNA helicase
LSVKVCVSCDELIDNDEKICPSCDSFFLKKKCPKCDEVMKDNVKKCWYCGYDFTAKIKKDKKIKDIYDKYLNELKNTNFVESNSINNNKYIKLTEEQIEIIKNARNNNLIINAFAGAGKSVTLLSIAYALKNKTFLFLAFNNSVKKDIERKIKKSNLKNVKVLTTHGLAYNFVKKDIKFDKIGKDLNTSEISKLLGIDIFISDLIRIAFNDFCNGNYKDISDETIDEIINNNVSLKFISENKEYLKEKLNIIWNMYLNKELDITHNVYLKYFQLNIEKYKNYINFDYVLLDEAQDTNEVVLDIFKNLNGKKIIVGDPHQQIYSFRGSINAMYKIRNEIDAKVLYLTQTFRFSKFIAEKANFILKNFKNEEKEIISSKISNSNEINSICYITRTNSTLIKIIEKLKDYNIKLIRTPREIFNLPLSIYYYIEYLKNGKYKDRIKEKWILNFKELDDLKDYAEDFEDYELISAINIAEEYGKKLFDLLKIAEEKYEAKESNIYLTTAHTSKGLEWDKVIITHDFPNIIDLIKKEKYKTIKDFRKAYKKHIDKILNGENNHFKHQYIIDEINLFYVALTRAKKKVLFYSNDNIFEVDKLLE